MDSAGVFLAVLELTDSSNLPLYRRRKERSKKIVLYCLDLLGTSMATGEILSLLEGRLFLMSPYRTMAE